MKEIDCFGNLAGITFLYSYMLLLNVGFTFFLFYSHKELNNKYIRTISYINYLQKTLNECVNKESGSEESVSEESVSEESVSEESGSEESGSEESGSEESGSEESGSEESGSEIINEGYSSLREASNKVKNWVYNEY